jgi:quinol monooxygenase YgiN
MLVVRFKARVNPDKASDVAQAMAAVVNASRGLEGVHHFDVARDLTDDNAFVATEVFDDRAAMERQEAQPEVARVFELFQGGALAGPPEYTIYHVASSESPSLG